MALQLLHLEEGMQPNSLCSSIFPSIWLSVQSVPGDTPDCLCALNSVGAISLLFLKSHFLSNQLNGIYQASSAGSERSTRHMLQTQIKTCAYSHSVSVGIVIKGRFL